MVSSLSNPGVPKGPPPREVEMMARGLRVRRVLAASAAPAIMVLAVLIGACGGGSPTAPASPSPIPITSAPPPPAAALTACQRIGFGTGSGNDCPRSGASFQAQVEAAMDRVIATQPTVFDLGSPGGPGSYRVLKVGQYYVGLIDELDKQGLCADFDGEELQVKNSNGFNDQYDVITSNNFILRGDASYRSTCSPAAFPRQVGAPPVTAGCSLAPSREKACGRETSTLVSFVEAGIDQVMREHPEYFDPGDTQPGTGFIRILNGDAYFRDLAAAISSRGVCARYDGEEMAVKRDNTYSEQFDLYGGIGYARRGEGSYRVTCYPAAF
jgi:hypothetical protein